MQKRSGELNKRIKPELEKLKELEKGIESFERKISLAQDYENELSNASNSYERAMAHQDCENELGFSKPRQAVSSFQRKVSSLKRNKTKLEKKINELTRRKLRDIKHLVWDGSNLCYCGDEFIGLSALIPLTENTPKNYKITIIFDASIRRLLKKSDGEIKVLFSDSVDIHIVATKRAADETVLNFCETDKTSFIVTNDRFNDFPGSAAKRDGRMIRHEILQGQAFIHDIDVSVKY